MKFCPQCGTAFDPTARFCLECGFDKSTVEPVETGPSSAPGVVVTEQENSPVTPIEVAPPPIVKTGCPQCGTTLDTGDRFCAECGFDTSTLGAAEVAQPKQPPVDDEIPLPEIPIVEPVLSPVDKQFCPSCGSGIGVGERFCPQCGLNITPGTTGRNQNFIPVDQPEARILQPPIPVQQIKPVIPPSETIQSRAPANIPPTRTTAPPNQKKRKKTWLWIALILIGLGVVGVAGWFGYTNYFGQKDDIVSDTISNMVLPPVSDIDTSAKQTEIAEETDATEPEEAKTTAKPLSKIDQELARQKAKEPKKSVPQATPPAQKTNPEQNEKEPANTTVNENLVKVILEVGRKEEPKSKNPKGPTKLLIQKPTVIVRIITDHYNNGMGTPRGGIIKITDRNGLVIGSYKAMGKTGKNNTPSSKWVAEPNIRLEKGTYFIEDSDQATWSKNFVGTGFVIVEGYEVK